MRAMPSKEDRVARMHHPVESFLSSPVLTYGAVGIWRLYLALMAAMMALAMIF
jgi:hypothetical protein